MSTKFTCPKCGNHEERDDLAMMRFRYGAVWVLFHNVEITESGYCVCGDWSDIDLHDESTVICTECGYEGEWDEFEEGGRP